MSIRILPLLLGALLLALHPLALATHVAWEAGHSESHHHDAGTCPTCELFASLSSSQFDTDDAATEPVPVQFPASKISLPEQPFAAIHTVETGLSRAPPCSPLSTAS